MLVRFGREILRSSRAASRTEVDARLPLRHRRHGRARASLIGAVRSRRHPARARADQDRLHLGRHPGRRGARAATASTQPDAAVLVLPGGGVRRGRGAADLALRRPHLRLAQEGGRRAGTKRQRRRERPGRAVGARRSTSTTSSFGIETEVMGASFRNVGQIAGAGRLRPADHQPRTAGRAAGQRSAAGARARPGRGAGARRSRSRCTTTKRASATRSTRTRWRPRSWPKASAPSPPTRSSSTADRRGLR